MKIGLEGFNALVNNLFDFMSRDKKAKPSRVELWYSKVSNFTAIEIREAFEYMKDNLDSLPHNLPKALKNAIFMMNKSKPSINAEKFKQHMYGQCDDCNGMGIFKILYYDQFNNRSEPIRYCSQCDNYKYWTNDPGDRMSKTELEAAGYTFKPYNKVLVKSAPSGNTGTEKELKNIAVDFGESKRLNEGKKYKNRYIKHEEK